MTPRQIIVDCDPGQDDAIALLLAFASPDEIEVLGVTAVAGNVPLALTAGNALRICELAGRRDVAVHAGADAPLSRALCTAEQVHGESGIDGAGLPAAATGVRDGHAADFLVERIMASDGGITLAALGPLTNLALALRREPRIAGKLRGIVLMGGALGPGNITPAAEFNIYVDPEAAAEVFSCGAPHTMIGLDVTHRAVATAARVDAIAAIGTAAADAVAGMLSLHLDDRLKGAPIHDPCVIAHILRPGLFEARNMRVRVITAEGADLGRTVADTSGAPNVSVVTDVDAEGLFDLLTRRLATLK